MIDLTMFTQTYRVGHKDPAALFKFHKFSLQKSLKFKGFIHLLLYRAFFLGI